MGMLHSLSYQPKLLSLDIMYHLFKDLPDCKDFDSSIETIEAAMNGRINLEEEFNLAGYDHVIKANQTMNKSKDAGEMVFLDDCENENVYTDAVLLNCTPVDEYEELLEKDELQYSVKKLLSLSSQFIVEEGIDFICTIRIALDGIPHAIKCLRKLCEDYSFLGQHIQVILASGVPFVELFP